MPTRLEIFREYMRHLDTAANPAEAVNKELYVPRPGRQLYDEISIRFSLSPTLSYLFVGGIGTGKTTQLLMAQKQLSTLPDTLALYIDVSESQDLSRIKPGTIVALIAISMVNSSTYISEQKRNEFRYNISTYTKGEWETITEKTGPLSGLAGRYESTVTRKVWKDGLITPPGVSDLGSLEEITKTCLEIKKEIEKSTPNIIVFIDSIDRVLNKSTIESILKYDMSIIKKIGIGNVLVGSHSFRDGMKSELLADFDKTIIQPLLNPKIEINRTFFQSVLRKRVSVDMLPDQVAEAMIMFSGGVLRDLLSIARAAGEEAYIAGEDSITMEHVKIAVDAFSRTLLLRLQERDVKRLQAMQKEANLLITADDLPLLASGCVLEYPPGELVRYAIHPTLSPLLERQAA
jgi:hypothetical protein